MKPTNDSLRLNEIFSDFAATLTNCALYQVKELSKDGNYTFVIPPLVRVPQIIIESITDEESGDKSVSVTVSCGELKSANYSGKTIEDAVEIALYNFLPVIYSEGENQKSN